MIDEKSILVTIGIPFYKDVETLAYAIKSVQRQTWGHFELILLDDGGNDGSLEVAKRFLGDSRVSLVSDGENKGLPQRLNELIDMAKGKYFARMDADDIMHPERIRTQVCFLEKNPSVDVLGTGAYSIDVNNRILGIKKSKLQNPTERDCFYQTAVMHPTVLAKIEWYRCHKYSTDKKYIRAEDFELWCRSLQNTRFANIKNNLMFYREGNSIKKSINNQLLTYKNSINIINEYGLQYLSALEVFCLNLKITTKRMIYIVLKYTGLLNVFVGILLGKRYVVISNEEKRINQSIIDDIVKENEE